MINEDTDIVRSNHAVPPGLTLAEELEARGVTQKEFAVQCGRPVEDIGEIISGARAITAEIALDFERALGVSAEFWLNHESRYRLTLARNKLKETA